MILASSNLTTSFITTSLMLVFSQCCASHKGQAPFSKWIQCIQIKGSIPFKSAIVLPIASLHFFNTSNKLSSWSFCRSTTKMISRMSLDTRKAYLSLSSSGFNSSFGGDSTEETGGVLDVKGRGSFNTLHGWKFALATVSRNSWTSSMYWAVSKTSKPKWVKQVSNGSFVKRLGSDSSIYSSMLS